MNISCYYDIKLKIINFMSFNFYTFLHFYKNGKNSRVIEPRNFYDIIDYTVKNTKITSENTTKIDFFCIGRLG